MSTGDRPQKLEKILLLLVAAFFVVAIPFTLANYKSGPVHKVQGTVLATRGLQGETSPTVQLVSLRLTTGEIVQATTIPGIVASDGDLAFVNAYRHAISGAPSYEVVRVERER